MRLFIKQKVFSFVDRFTVKDESGEDKYYVEGEFLSFGKRLHIYNTSGEELIYIQQKVFSFLPRYHIFIGGREVAEVVKEFTFFYPKYSIHGFEWSIEGDFFDHEYSVLQNGTPVVSMYKEWFTWGDSYVLDIANPLDELAAVAVILAIDCATEPKNNS
jgi:uncharacterized protein YxjI